MIEPTREQVGVAVRVLRRESICAGDDGKYYRADALWAVANHLERAWKLGDQVPAARDAGRQLGQ